MSQELKELYQRGRGRIWKGGYQNEGSIKEESLTLKVKEKYTKEESKVTFRGLQLEQWVPGTSSVDTFNWMKDVMHIKTFREKVP